MIEVYDPLGLPFKLKRTERTRKSEGYMDFPGHMLDRRFINLEMYERRERIKKRWKPVAFFVIKAEHKPLIVTRTHGKHYWQSHLEYDLLNEKLKPERPGARAYLALQRFGENWVRRPKQKT